MIDVLPEYGEVEYGLDIFTLGPAGECSQPELLLAPVKARYLRLLAIEGDGAYATAEFQVYGKLIE